MIQAQIKDEILQKILAEKKDEMTMFILNDGSYRGAYFDGTRLVNQMRANHNLGLLETMTLGQALLSTALLIPMMKGREHLTVRYEIDGACRGFQAEADSTGYVRGFLFNNPIPIEKPLESWDLSPFLGIGTLTISRIGEGMKQAQVGSVEATNRNIAKDFAWYFEQSEQTKTAFSTSIQFDKEGRVVGAGGLFLQKVASDGGKKIDSPNEDEWYAERIENAFSACPSLGKWISEGGIAEDLIFGLFREFKPVSVLTRNVKFDCPCSAENFAQKIKLLGKNELDEILKDDEIEVVCHNCGSVYKIKKELLK